MAESRGANAGPLSEISGNQTAGIDVGPLRYPDQSFVALRLDLNFLNGEHLFATLRHVVEIGHPPGLRSAIGNFDLHYRS